MDAGALYDSKLFGQGLHLALDLVVPRFEVLFLFHYLGAVYCGPNLVLVGLVFIHELGTSLTMTRRVLSSSHN